MMKHYSKMHRVNCRGVGLIEIMIALALGAIIMLGVTQIATNNSNTRNELERFGRQLEAANFAMGAIEADVTNAAYWGERGSLDPNSPSPICPADAGELELSMGFPIQGGQGTIDCTPADFATKANTDYLAVRRASSCANGSTGCPAAAGDYHLQVHACFDSTSALKPGDSFKIDSNLSNLDLLKRSCNPADPSPKYRFISRIYYVDDNDTLRRAELSGDDYSSEALVENVEMMRFEYGLDTDGDSQVDDYASNVADPNDARWEDVVMVRVGLIVRNHEASAGFTDNRSYTVGGYAYTPPAALKPFRRQLYTRTISTRNIAGRREVN
ncbi:PilW family protein [Haliea sp. E17]|uniref:PilW family protein n=1 Tax=Haliea sp. E17 TaxID=3401576 RepID=UPI003AB01566